jgi:hypothetical protein
MGMIELPPAIRDWLVGAIERAWPDPSPVVAKVPAALPEGAVHRLAGGGPYRSPEERDAAEQACYAHNRAAYDLLRERWFEP